MNQRNEAVSIVDAQLLLSVMEELRDALEERWNEVQSAKSRKPSKKKKKKNKRKQQPLMPVPMPMPDPMVRKIKEMMRLGDGANDHGVFLEKIQFLGEKKLEESDLNKQQNRLLFPNITNDKLLEFMNEREKEKVVVDNNKDKKKNKNEGGGGGIRVPIVDVQGGVWMMDFKWWKSVTKYVFTKEWTQFVNHFNLHTRNQRYSAQIWCFRDPGSNFCFALNIIPPPPNPDATSTSGSGSIGGAATAPPEPQQPSLPPPLHLQ